MKMGASGKMLLALAVILSGVASARAQAVCEYFGGQCRDFCLSGEQAITPHFFACPAFLTGSAITCCQTVSVGPWGQWGVCSATCGTAVRSRTRPCLNAAGCSEPLTESQPCYLPTCPAVSNVGPWTPWSGCSATCGASYRFRFRQCNVAGGCAEQLYAMEPCVAPQCTDSVGQWSAWNACSVTCGQGQQERRRACLQTSCTSLLVETQPCTLPQCPPVSQWTAWSVCSVTCGSGSQQRTRTCLSASGCAEPLSDTQVCSLPACQNVSLWGAWSACSVTCGSGQRQRMRTCLSSSPCQEQLTQMETCTSTPCPVWSLWSPWNSCSVTCGGGTTFRLRQCVTSGTNSLTSGCAGSPIETKACGTEVCPDYTCGLSSPLTPRLYGGQAAVQCSNPWLVHFESVMGQARATTCSGVLVDRNSVLTTAMCGRLVALMTSSGLGVRITVGDFDVTVTSDGSMFSITPQEVTTHPGYSQPTSAPNLDPLFMESEYAVVQLPTEMTMDTCMNYACLPDQYRTPDFSNCKVLGFGFSGVDATGVGIKPEVLLEADAALGGTDFCLGNFAFLPGFPGPQAFNQSFLCGATGAQYNLCIGDESSLLTCPDAATGQWIAVGLGRVDPNNLDCATPSQSQVYAKVTPVLSWVRGVMAQNGGA